MKKFMDKDFLLTTKTAKEIYKKGAEKAIAKTEPLLKEVYKKVGLVI